MSVLQEQHARWAEARGRLTGEPVATLPPPPKPRGRPRGVPVPEFDGYGDVFRWKQIAYEVALKHSLTLPELMSHRRWRNIVIARQELFYRLSKETSLSFPDMAKKCGGFDHTTALHSIRMHAKRMEAAANAN